MRTLSLLACILPSLALAETPAVDPAIPSPEAFLGFDVAERPAHHAEVLRYFEELARLSPHATLREYARTHEARRMVLLVVTDAKNDTKKVRETLAKLGDPRQTDEDDAKRVARTTPAVAWMGYSIHGNEPSGTDAALTVAYRLVAGTDALAQKLREQLIVLVDPCMNPDGRERHLADLIAFAGRVPDPDQESISHVGVWPWGRWNHYLFDLNRDAASMLHPETRGRIRTMASWSPQLMVEAHEMWSDETYLFSPPRPPYNPHVPETVLPWTKRFAADQAAAFDAHGWSYYTGAWNEEFFPGYSSAWPTLLGTIGILYEQAGVDGVLVKQRSGKVLTYAESVEHQIVSSLANLTTLAEHREAILTDWARARRLAVSPRGKPRAYIVPGDQPPWRRVRLLRALRAHGIEVLTNSEPERATGLYGPWQEKSEARDLPVGSLMVRVDQPMSPAVHNLFDFHQPMTRRFLREQREYLERGKGTRLYDTSAWAVPFMYGVDVFWRDSVPSGSWRATTDADAEGPPGVLHHPSASYGFLIDPESDRSTYVVAGLLTRGMTVHVTREPFEMGGRHYRRGTFLLRRENNPPEMPRVVRALARAHGIFVRGVDTARVTDGPDLGGNDFQLLHAPRIGVIAGEPASAPSYGGIWHLLDHQAGLRMSGLEAARLHEVDLSRYNVLVFPSTWWGDYGQRLSTEAVASLKQWVEGGGTAIGVGNGAAWLATTLTGTRPRSAALEDFPPIVLGLHPRAAEAAGGFAGLGLRAEPPKKEPDLVDQISWWDEEHPYDIPPVVGGAARKFLPVGAPVFELPDETVSLADWIGPLAPAGEEAKKKTLAAADARLRRFNTRGVYLAVDLDPEHWLAWGNRERIASLFTGSEPFVAGPDARVAGRFAAFADLHLSGLLWPETAGRIALTGWAVRESKGRGQVILFADDPVFRGWTPAAQRVFMNAVVLGPGLGTDFPHPW